jgi:hypothetical protein
MVRGLERGVIFTDDADREDFIARLAHLAEQGGLTVYAWALLPNHAHLLAPVREHLTAKAPRTPEEYLIQGKIDECLRKGTARLLPAAANTAQVGQDADPERLEKGLRKISAGGSSEMMRVGDSLRSWRPWR